MTNQTLNIFLLAKTNILFLFHQIFFQDNFSFKKNEEMRISQVHLNISN